MNGSIAVSQKVNGISDQYRPEPLRSHRSETKSVPSPTEIHRAQRASIAESPGKDITISNRIVVFIIK